jgi:hypothetical protein
VEEDVEWNQLPEKFVCDARMIMLKVIFTTTKVGVRDHLRQPLPTLQQTLQLLRFQLKL